MSSTARGEEWKKYDKNLNKSVALEDLRDSVRQQNEEKVEKAMARCRAASLQDNEKVKEAAEIHLPVISARNRLKIACKELTEKGEVEKVRTELKSIKGDGLSPYLQLEVRDAKTLLERHEKNQRKEKPKAVSLAMDSKTVAEIRRYQNPPDVLRKVIQGALLLVGEDEDMTDSWKNCQRICNPYGDNGLCRRVINFDPSKAHPEIVARAKQILQDIKFDDVQSVGRSAPVTFYVWAMGSIAKSDDAEEKAKAEEKKQRQDPAGAKATTADNKTEKSAAPGEKDAKGEDKKQKQDPAGAKAPTTDNKTEKSGAPGDKTSKVDEKHEKKEESKAKPANRKRQKEIFGRLPKPQDDKDFYNMTVTTKKKSKGKAEGSKTKTDEQPSNTKGIDDHPSKAKMDHQPSNTKGMDQQPSKTKMDQQRPNDAKAK